MPRIVDHEAMREELLAGSFDLFATRGYAALTMRELARELGVSTGTLYHYFPTKEAIFEQMFASASARVTRDAVAALNDAETDAARIDRLLAYVKSEATLLRHLLVLIIDFQRYGRAEFVAEMVGFFRETVARELGNLNPADASFVLSVFFGILLQMQFDPNTPDLWKTTQTIMLSLAKQGETK